MTSLRAACIAALFLSSACGAESPVQQDSPPDVEEAAFGLTPTDRLYAPPAQPAAAQQVLALLRARKLLDAARVAVIATQPRGVWLVGGSPEQVELQVRTTLAEAKKSRSTPVLVAYNLPYRDCAQYSAGGAVDTAAYTAWVDGVARGIGSRKAIVILEPDGLGIIPYNTTIYGASDWCRPTVLDATGANVPAPGASPAERYAQLNYAVDSLAAQAPNASIYLDGTHSGWLGVGEAAYRLVRAGVQRTQGFFLNVSNYRTTAELQLFGSWVSSCIAAGTAGPDWVRDPATGGPHFDWCPSQYNPEKGYALDYSPEYAATVSAGLQGMLGEAVATSTFVIDTGRNGQGPWTPSVDYPDAQDWCNPPGRGVGLLPSLTTGVPLNDAYLWVKVPGESDGSCNRGIAGSSTDPEWGGITDPAAGAWFPEQALELARLAEPRLFGIQ